jgi:CHAD domain-containing protein
LTHQLLLVNPSDADAGSVTDAFAGVFDTQPGTVARSRTTWLETADSRLAKSGIRLREVTIGRRRQLFLTTDTGVVESGPATGLSWPGLPAQLGDGQLGELIGGAAAERAVVPACTVDTTGTTIRLLDRNAKTIGTALIEQRCLTAPYEGTLPVRITLTALRGYHKELRPAVTALLASGARTAQWFEDTMPEFDRGTGWLQPAKARVTLRDSDPAARSVAIVLLALLDEIEQNVAGTRADLDIEFLHDLRIAVRATRSLLKLTGDVLPEGTVENFAPRWRSVGAFTAPTRDLDVLDVAVSGGDPAFGGASAEDFTPFREWLAKRRRAEFRRLSAALGSTEFTDLLGEWRAVLTQAAKTSRKARGMRTDKLVVTRMDKARRRAGKLADGLTESCPIEDVHDLRKRCKELRYLRDAFLTIGAADEHRKTIRELKALQDVLGEIQDDVVLLDALGEYAASTPAPPVATVLALGAVKDRLEQRQRHARAELPAVLTPVTGHRPAQSNDQTAV